MQHWNRCRFAFFLSKLCVMRVFCARNLLTSSPCILQLRLPCFLMHVCCAEYELCTFFSGLILAPVFRFHLCQGASGLHSISVMADIQRVECVESCETCDLSRGMPVSQRVHRRNGTECVIYCKLCALFPNHSIRGPHDQA